MPSSKIENNHNSLLSTFYMPVVVLGNMLILSLPRSWDMDLSIPILQIQNLSSVRGNLPEPVSPANLDLNLKSLSHSFWIFINYCVLSEY